jgi:hypothetical protein
MGSGRVKGSESRFPPPSLGCWGRRTADGVKVERPTGRTTLTPARTVAGCRTEKALWLGGAGLTYTHSGLLGRGSA